MNNQMYEMHKRKNDSLCVFDGTGYHNSESVNNESIILTKEQLCVNRSIM